MDLTEFFRPSLYVEKHSGWLPLGKRRSPPDICAFPNRCRFAEAVWWRSFIACRVLFRFVALHRISLQLHLPATRSDGSPLLRLLSSLTNACTSPRTFLSKKASEIHVLRRTGRPTGPTFCVIGEAENQSLSDIARPQACL